MKILKTTIIVISTMKSEFIALDKCGEEAEWLRHFLEDILRWSILMSSICIHCDSQFSIGKTQNSMDNDKSKHIRL